MVSDGFAWYRLVFGGFGWFAVIVSMFFEKCTYVCMGKTSMIKICGLLTHWNQKHSSFIFVAPINEIWCMVISATISLMLFGKLDFENKAQI